MLNKDFPSSVLLHSSLLSDTRLEYLVHHVRKNQDEDFSFLHRLLSVRSRLNVGDCVLWSTTSGSVLRRVTLAVRGRVNVGDSVVWSSTSGSVLRRVTLAVRGRVNVGDSVVWSTTSGSVLRRVTLAVRGRVNVGDSVVWSTTSGSVLRKCDFGSQRPGQRW